MAITGNKGEWSEIYALFRLLGEGKVHAGDADLNKLDLYYPILNIIREESKKYEYKPDTEKTSLSLMRMATNMRVSQWISLWKNPQNCLNPSKELRGKEPLRFQIQNVS